jgi:DNA repair protein RecO (recombination protein O)
MAWEAYQTEGIIVESREAGEADRNITLYSKDYGTVSLHGKSVRLEKSKLRGALNIFQRVRVVFVIGKDRYRLTDVEVIERFELIEQELWRFRVATLVARVIKEVASGEEGDDNVWQLLLKFMHTLNNANFRNEQQVIALYIFQIRLLNVLGYLPENPPVIIQQLYNTSPFNPDILFSQRERLQVKAFLREIYSYATSKPDVLGEFDA